MQEHFSLDSTQRLYIILSSGNPNGTASFTPCAARGCVTTPFQGWVLAIENVMRVADREVQLRNINAQNYLIDEPLN